MEDYVDKNYQRAGQRMPALQRHCAANIKVKMYPTDDALQKIIYLAT